ncbi:MFS transporter [Nostocoides japonicum]|uniref:MFS transporter n=1 Tax=Nostocoides japonicum TaxID=99481 RepID=UPI00065BB93A|nr:MFS transporter [Tetrasphaera japonica]
MSSPTRSPAPGAAGPGTEDYVPDPNRWKALTVCLVAGFMTLLDVSIVNVALPSIRTGLGAGENTLSWVVSGYALSFGLLLVPAGRLGDARGRRPTLIAGLGIFTLASAACGFAHAPVVLIVARLVQGLGGGMISPQVSGLIQSLFRGAERGKAFGFFGATVGVSTAVGPLVGGLLIAVFGTESGWRYVFFVNLPIGLAAMLLTRRLVPHTPRDRVAAGGQDLDPVGVLLLGLAVLLVILPFIEQQTWRSPIRPWLFPVAGLLFVAFVLWERRYLARGREPVIDFRLYARTSYTAGTLIGLVYFAGFTAIFFIYAQVLQEGLGYSALLSGLAALPFAIGSAGAAAIGGRVVTRIGRKLVVAGLVLVLAGVLAVAVVGHLVQGTGLGWAAAAPLLVAGIGGGLVISPNVTLTLSEVPVAQAGVAGGALQTAQRIGSAAGIAITGSVFYGVLAGSRPPDFDRAFVHGLLVVALFVAVALALGLFDAVTGSGYHGRHEG